MQTAWFMIYFFASQTGTMIYNYPFGITSENTMKAAAETYNAKQPFESREECEAAMREKFIEQLKTKKVSFGGFCIQGLYMPYLPP